MFQLKAANQYPSDVTKEDIDRVLARKGRCDIAGLDYKSI